MSQNRGGDGGHSSVRGTLSDAGKVRWSRQSNLWIVSLISPSMWSVVAWESPRHAQYASTSTADLKSRRSGLVIIRITTRRRKFRFFSTVVILVLHVPDMVKWNDLRIERVFCVMRFTMYPYGTYQSSTDCLDQHQDISNCKPVSVYTRMIFPGWHRQQRYLVKAMPDNDTRVQVKIPWVQKSVGCFRRVSYLSVTLQWWCIRVILSHSRNY